MAGLRKCVFILVKSVLIENFSFCFDDPFVCFFFVKTFVFNNHEFNLIKLFARLFRYDIITQNDETVLIWKRHCMILTSLFFSTKTYNWLSYSIRTARSCSRQEHIESFRYTTFAENIDFHSNSCQNELFLRLPICYWFSWTYLTPVPSISTYSISPQKENT